MSLKRGKTMNFTSDASKTAKIISKNNVDDRFFLGLGNKGIKAFK